MGKLTDQEFSQAYDWNTHIGSEGQQMMVSRHNIRGLSCNGTPDEYVVIGVSGNSGRARLDLKNSG